MLVTGCILKSSLYVSHRHRATTRMLLPRGLETTTIAYSIVQMSLCGGHVMYTAVCLRCPETATVPHRIALSEAVASAQLD
jgi:hypothetical protein